VHKVCFIDAVALVHVCSYKQMYLGASLWWQYIACTTKWGI